MYITSNTAALETSGKAHKVYLILCQYANYQNRECFVSKRTISEKAGLSLSSVVRALRELVQRDLIRIVSRFTGDTGRQTSNRYILLDSPQLNMDGLGQEVPKADAPRLYPIDKAAANLSPLPCRIYAYLASLAGKARECVVSRRRIADACGVCLSTVTKAISALCRDGLLGRIRQTRWERQRTHGRRANRYYLFSHPAPKLSPQGKTLLLYALLLAKRIFTSFLPNRAVRRTAAHAQHIQEAICLSSPFSFPFCLTPSPCASLTPQGTNILRKIYLTEKNNPITGSKADIYTGILLRRMEACPMRDACLPRRPFSFRPIFLLRAERK